MARTLTHGQAITPATFTGQQVTSTANDSGQPDDQAALPHVLIERQDGTFFDEGVLPTGVTQPTGGEGLLGALGNLIQLLTLATNTSGTTGAGFNVRVTAGGGGGGGIADSVTVTNTVAVTGAVSISNFPATQPVSGTVSVGNFPATQTVAGAVSVSNLPSDPALNGALPTGVSMPAGGTNLLGVLGGVLKALNGVLNTRALSSGTDSVTVAGTVGISGTATVAGAVSVSNFPGTQAVSGTVSVGNFPATQTVAGSVSVSNLPGDPALNGALPTGVSMPTGGTSMLGILGGIYSKLSGTLQTRALSSGTDSVTVTGGVTVSGTATVSGAVSVSNFPATQTVAGSVTVGNFPATQAISAASLPLPTGAATAVKQPAFSTAGSASADVLSVQGIASMTPLKTDGSGVTQPVSAPAGAALALDGTDSTDTNATQATAGVGLRGWLSTAVALSRGTAGGHKTNTRYLQNNVDKVTVFGIDGNGTDGIDPVGTGAGAIAGSTVTGYGIRGWLSTLVGLFQSSGGANVAVVGGLGSDGTGSGAGTQVGGTPGQGMRGWLSSIVGLLQNGTALVQTQARNASLWQIAKAAPITTSGGSGTLNCSSFQHGQLALEIDAATVGGPATTPATLTFSVDTVDQNNVVIQGGIWQQSTPTPEAGGTILLNIGPGVATFQTNKVGASVLLGQRLQVNWVVALGTRTSASWPTSGQLYVN